ncbi:UNVERIFIED_CONTAM: hypothetical protein FKN15_077934 [Acipenser sinensis]
MDGELILAFGAGFAGSEGGSDPGCEGGGDRITFQDPDRYQWYDPTLWRAASTPDDLENGRFQFSVHEESVPCEHDDVIFRPDSSFRVSTDADVSRISLRSVSIMEKKFSREEEFARYLQSGSGKLQFHGSGTVQVTNSRCSESSGCDCGNTAVSRVEEGGGGRGRGRGTVRVMNSRCSESSGCDCGNTAVSRVEEGEGHSAGNEQQVQRELRVRLREHCGE